MAALLLSHCVAVGSEVIDFSKKGVNLFQSSSGWQGQKGTVTLKEDVIHLEAPNAGRFSFKAPIGESGEYLFSAKVKSDDRVVFAAPRFTMSYHDQGHWGEVCGLVSVSNQKELEVALHLRPLQGRGMAKVELKEVRLQKVERPGRVSDRHFPGETVLAKNGKAQGVIVYPAALETEKQLAEAVKEGIKKRCGVALPVVADTEITEKDAPIVKPAFRDENLILIGRLGTNRALVSGYARFLDAVDGYYPGGDGYVVRTAANVFGNGKNHLVLGGSESAGVANAVRQFLGLLEKAEIKEKGTLALPWLLDVKLGGECLENFRADNARWSDANNSSLPAMTSGYGKVSRWYQNAMGYYWSGWPECLERSRGYLKEVLADKAYTHHYLLEFFVRSYDMLDESPILSEADKAAMNGLIVENFLDFMTGPDASWMTVFSPPYQEIGLTNRHQIAPWFADLVASTYLKKNLQASGDLKRLIDFRFSEKDKAFRDFVSNRSGPTRYELGYSSYEEITATFFRYAMENDLYHEFFDSGLAHRALGLELLNPVNGRLTMPAGMRDLEPLLGAVATIRKDGRYRWIRENTPFPVREVGAFQGRFVADVHRYASGSELPAVKPDASWSGIAISPEPTRRDGELTPPTNEFPLVSMRSGFGPKDDYVAITGIRNQQPSGTLAAMIVQGNQIFVATPPEGGGAANRTTTNGATVVRLSDYAAVASKGEGCSLNWTAETAGCWAFQTETAISPDVRWSRNTIRLRPGLFVFCDRFTVSRSGEYAFRVNWQPGEDIKEENGVWQLPRPTGTVQIKMLGEGFETLQRDATLTWASTRNLEAGKSANSVHVWTVVQAKADKDSTVTASLQTADQLRITPLGSRPILLHAGDFSHATGMVKADLTILDEKGVSILGRREGDPGSTQSCLYLPKEGNELVVGIGQALENFASRASEAKPGSAPGNAVTIEDRARQWKAVWSYDGLLKPSEVKFHAIEANLVDFKREVLLDEMRSLPRSKRVWEPTFLPEKVAVAMGSAPPSEENGWTPLSGKRKSRPGTRTGNYGESHPMSHVDESLFVDGVKTRFLKADEAAKARYFIRDERVARHPVRIEVLRDLPGYQEPLILASSYLFPAFPRPVRDDDFSLALLKPEGGALVELDIAGPVQGTLIADRQGKGVPEIMVLKADARIETFDLTGKPGPVADLAAMQEEFDKKHGRPNTRHPAGGLFMPFSFGLWRANAAGAKKMVVARYGNLSFLDENLQLEGVLNAGYYAHSGMLKHAYDFSGSGQEEMLLLNRSLLVQIGGDSKPGLRHKKPAVFWPEVYETLAEKAAKDSECRLLAGAPIYVFEVLDRFAGRPRYAAVVRGSYAGLYDAVEKEWVFSWQPPAPIAAAALTRESADGAEIHISTVDGLFWKLTWEAAKPGTPTIGVQSLGWVAKELRGTPSRDGRAVLSTDQGLLLLDQNGRLTRIAEGAFQSADFLSDVGSRQKIMAADQQGRIHALEAQQ